MDEFLRSDGWLVFCLAVMWFGFRYDPRWKK
jgi:hypothetical protein